jgi:hypothetical protein
VKRPATVAASAAVVGVIAISSASTAPRATATPKATPRLAGPPPTIVQYGYVRSLVRAGSRYRLRFDPALFLSGETANRAAVEDGAIPPGDIVPNDYYVRNETKKQLTFAVLPGARVTVVTNSGASGLRSTRASVSELAAIVKGRNPKKRRLYGNLGYWARVAGDRVVALDQQYQP